MSDLGGSSFDPDLWCLVSLAERSYQDIEEMASSIESSSEEALATEAANLNPPCCQFAGRVTSSSLGGMSELLELALSEDFREYYFFVLFSSSLVSDYFLLLESFSSIFPGFVHWEYGHCIVVAQSLVILLGASVFWGVLW